MSPGRSPVPSSDSGFPFGTAGLGWLVPGAAHLALGDLRRGLVCGGVLLLMFVIGLSFGGRLFPFQVADPLMFLAALAEWALGAPRLLAGLAGWGQGMAVATTYEYGNTFLIAAGLLNLLVVMDASDRARGRKGR